MTPSAASNSAQSPDHPSHGLQCTVAVLLSPIFNTAAPDPMFAFEATRHALNAYAPETKADYVNIGRTLAFSMAAIALLGDAGLYELPIAQRLRIFGRANALNRAADQSERTMMQRRSYQKTNPPPETLANLAPEPSTTDLDDAVVQASIAATMATYTTALAQGQTEAAPQPPATAKPTLNLDPPPAPVSAIHYSGPNRASTPSQKLELLRHGAMHHTAPLDAKAATPHPH